jgi:pyrrolidone-carboxylate peptidase
VAVLEGGAESLECTWPSEAVGAAIRATGVAVEPSDDAGGFACNAAHYLALAAASCPVGFLHVPARAWPLAPRVGRLARAVEAVLGVLRDHR